MFEQFDRVKYVGHLKGCTSCDATPPVGEWASRVGKEAVFLGRRDRDDQVKVHFDGEDLPCYVYLAHLDRLAAR